MARGGAGSPHLRKNGGKVPTIADLRAIARPRSATPSLSAPILIVEQIAGVVDGEDLPVTTRKDLTEVPATADLPALQHPRPATRRSWPDTDSRADRLASLMAKITRHHQKRPDGSSSHCRSSCLATLAGRRPVAHAPILIVEQIAGVVDDEISSPPERPDGSSSHCRSSPCLATPGRRPVAHAPILIVEQDRRASLMAKITPSPPEKDMTETSSRFRFWWRSHPRPVNHIMHAPILVMEEGAIGCGLRQSTWARDGNRRGDSRLGIRITRERAAGCGGFTVAAGGGQASVWQPPRSLPLPCCSRGTECRNGEQWAAPL